MNKSDLIFDWTGVESHPAWKGAAVVMVAFGFLIAFSFFRVNFKMPDSQSAKSASVVLVPDEELGRLLRMKAEEEGPFPGRLEIAGLYEPLEWAGFGTLGDKGAWNDYSIALRPLNPDSEDFSNRVSAQGQRVFPYRNRSLDKPQTVTKIEHKLVPLLIPYNQRAAKWLPNKLPDLQMQADERMASADWRFVLKLRADGAVEQCISLSGGGGESLFTMVEWLEAQRFQASDQEERWFGLRVEFLNKSNDGSESQ